MNNGKKKINKKILIIICAIVILGFIMFFLLTNKNQNVTLLCEQLESDENARLSTKVVINKKGKQIHFNYTGTAELFNSNETAHMLLGMYIEAQILEFKKIDDSMANFEKIENGFTFEYNFDMSPQIKEEIENLFGIYSEDIEELKKHFESGGTICEEI